MTRVYSAGKCVLDCLKLIILLNVILQNQNDMGQNSTQNYINLCC